MENLKTIYFTPGELARYVGISKALLLYYDRENIFKPVTTDENGYRYYLAEQFFELQIVTNLRKLGLPLPEIKAYLANKNLKELENLLTVQNKELDRDIKLLQSKKRSLQKFAQELTNVHDVVLETPTVVALPKQFIEISESFLLTAIKKSNMDIFIKQQVKFKAHPYHVDPAFGMLITHNNFLGSAPLSNCRLFRKLSDHKHLPAEYTTKPAGNYLTIYLQGTKLDMTKRCIPLFKAYLTAHELKPSGDLFVYPLTNFWTCKKRSDYIFQFQILVEAN
ncbi:MAG: MerR family transcriptional regulator [Acidaminococcaceae bacterium]